VKKVSHYILGRGLTILKFDQTRLIYSVSYFNLGELGALFGEDKPPPMWRRTGLYLNNRKRMVFAAMFVRAGGSVKVLLTTIYEIETIQTIWCTHHLHNEIYKLLKQTLEGNHSTTGKK